MTAATIPDIPTTTQARLSPSLRFLCSLLRGLCLLIAFFAGLALVLGAVVGIGVLIWKPEQAATVAGFSLLVVPVGGLLYGVLNGERLFRALKRGEFFTVPTATALQRFAIGMTVYKLSPVLVMIPMVLLLRLGVTEAKFERVQWQGLNLELGPGSSADSAGSDFTGDPFITLIFLGAIILFASVMKRAAALAEEADRLRQENAQFV